MRHGVIAGLLALSVACGGGDSNGPAPEPKPSIAGSWGGTSSQNGTTITVTAVMVDNNGTITGNGTLSAPGINCSHSLTGTRSDKNFSVTMTCVGFQPLGYAGQVVNNTTLDGNLNGSGFADAPMQMTKQ